MTNASLTFFDRPDAEKSGSRSTKPGARGYNAMRGRTVGKSHDSTYLASLQESYAVGRTSVPDDPYFFTKEAGHSFADNIWPDLPSDFEPAMTEYYNAMERTYRTIMRLFAVALDLPETYFDNTIDKHGSLLRLTHYPSLDSEPLPGEYRSGAHTDGGTLTILHIDDTPNSLQVKLRSGEWINVNRIPGAFVINIGDMMMRWTNDKWVSNWHRVVNPPDGERPFGQAPVAGLFLRHQLRHGGRMPARIARRPAIRRAIRRSYRANTRRSVSTSATGSKNLPPSRPDAMPTQSRSSLRARLSQAGLVVVLC